MCPVATGKSAATWCTDGLAGALVSIARNGNSLTEPAPASYRICIDRRLGAGTRVDVQGANAGVLTPSQPCGCFRGAQIQIQNNSAAPAPSPQQGDLGGTYQAFSGASCEKDAPLLKVGTARTVVAPCGAPDATGKDCTVALGGRGKITAARLCFPRGYVTNAGNTGNISLRLDGYRPVPGPGYDARDNLLTTTCLDVFDARTVTIRLGLWNAGGPDLNTAVRFTVAPLRR